MATIKKGARISVIKQGITKFVPNEGQTYVEHYESLSKLDALGRDSIYRASGYHTEIDLTGPIFKVSATFYKPSVTAPFYTDKWTWKKEVVTDSIWNHPKVIEERANASSPFAYRKTIEDAVDDPETNTDSGGIIGMGAFTYANAVFRHLLDGVDSYEFEKLVVQRTRQGIVYQNGNKSNFTNAQMVSSSIIYRTSDFLSVFSVPKNIRDIMPAAQDDPSQDYAWGWRIREQNGDFESPIKFTETIDWIYSAWSLLFYELY